MKKKQVVLKLKDSNYDTGRELGREARKRLEKNLRRYIIAGVIAMGCGLLLTGLKSPWYINIIGVFISYQITDYGLSKLFKKLKIEHS